MRCKETPVVNSEYKNQAAWQRGVSRGLPAFLQTVPDEVLQVIAGNMLGDGHVQGTKNGIVRGNARYGITMIASIFLCSTTYASFKPSVLIPWPNTNGKDIAHYYFCTSRCPFFTEFHTLWYRWDPDPDPDPDPDH